MHCPPVLAFHDLFLSILSLTKKPQTFNQEKLNFKMLRGVLSRDSSVGIVTRIRDGRSGFRISAMAKDLFFSKTSRPAVGPTQPPTKWVPGIFPGVKRLGREIDITPSSAEVKNGWSYNSTLPIFLHGVYRNNFTLAFTFTRLDARKCMLRDLNIC